jgi:hypothetical protein
MTTARPNPSTGPRSAEGKARSSKNALKSGIYAKSLIIPGEDPARLDTLRDEYSQRFCPDLPEQRDLVDILVRSTWTLRRLAVAEAQVWTYSMDSRSELDDTSPLGHAFNYCDKTLTRLQRMVNSTQRNYRDALRELERIRPLPTPAPSQPAETKPVTTQQEFVSSTSSTAPKSAPTAVPKALPFHQPGSTCCWEPADPVKYRNFKQCIACYPNQKPSQQ